MNFGNSQFGCNGCELKHPRMCKESMEYGYCTEMGTNQKCRGGYHRKNTGTNTTTLSTGTTTPSPSLPPPHIPPPSPPLPPPPSPPPSSGSSPSLGGCNTDTLRSVFGEILREEVVKLRMDMDRITGQIQSQITNMKQSMNQKEAPRDVINVLRQALIQ